MCVPGTWRSFLLRDTCVSAYVWTLDLVLSPLHHPSLFLPKHFPLFMNNPAFDLSRSLLTELENQGLDKGNRGELIGMTLCLLARDAAVKKLDNRVIPVSAFIRELVAPSDRILNSKPVRARTPDAAQKSFEDTFCHSNIFFNHFVKFRDRNVINRRYLWRLIARGAAQIFNSASTL